MKYKQCLHIPWFVLTRVCFFLFALLKKPYKSEKRNKNGQTPLLTQ